MVDFYSQLSLGTPPSFPDWGASLGASMGYVAFDITTNGQAETAHPVISALCMGPTIAIITASLYLFTVFSARKLIDLIGQFGQRASVPELRPEDAAEIVAKQDDGGEVKTFSSN